MPAAPVVVKLVMLTLGIPGLPNFVSPSKPGMPSDVPASACPATENWFRVSKSTWWYPILKSLRRVLFRVWVYPKSQFLLVRGWMMAATGISAPGKGLTL